MENCVFCKIIKGELPCVKIYDDEYTFAFLNLNPVNQGHSLVIPKNHSEQLLLNHNGDIHHVMDTIRKIVPAIIKAVNANGWNLQVNNGKAAGQVIFHTHFHIIPRFDNDNFKKWPHKEASVEEREKIRDRILEEL